MYFVEQTTVIKFVPDGIGFIMPAGPAPGGNSGNKVPAEGRIFTFLNTEAVPGDNAPTQGNFNTAITTLSTDVEANIATNLAAIQGIATGATS